MKKLIVSVALASLSLLAWSLPTLQQVEAEVRQGHYTQAESMMREVVAARPDSARAHYIYAEILAHDGKTALALEEAKAARQIDPYTAAAELLGCWLEDGTRSRRCSSPFRAAPRAVDHLAAP